MAGLLVLRLLQAASSWQVTATCCSPGEPRSVSTTSLNLHHQENKEAKDAQVLVLTITKVCLIYCPPEANNSANNASMVGRLPTRPLTIVMTKWFMEKTAERCSSHWYEQRWVFDDGNSWPQRKNNIRFLWMTDCLQTWRAAPGGCLLAVSWGQHCELMQRQSVSSLCCACIRALLTQQHHRLQTGLRKLLMDSSMSVWMNVEIPGLFWS